jgi:hypothetical protein
MPPAAYRPHDAPTTFAGPTAVQGVGDGDETVARRIGIVTRRDDDFLARTEPFAQPRGDGLAHASAGYAEGLRHSRAGLSASRHNERRDAMLKAFVVGAGLMGAAVVAAAAFTILVFAGLFTVSSGVDGGHRAATLAQQPPSTTTPPPSPSTTTPPPSPSNAIAPPSQSATTAPVSRSTAAQTGRSRLPSSNRVATPRTAAGAQVPAPPPPAEAPAPALPPVSAPNLNPAGKAPPGHNK